MSNDLKLFEIKASSMEEALEIARNEHGITEDKYTIHKKEVKEPKKIFGFIDVKGIY